MLFSELGTWGCLREPMALATEDHDAAGEGARDQPTKQQTDQVEVGQVVDLHSPLQPVLGAAVAQAKNSGVEHQVVEADGVEDS